MDPVSNLISMKITSALKSSTTVGGNVFKISVKMSVPLWRNCPNKKIPMKAACFHH